MSVLSAERVNTTNPSQLYSAHSMLVCEERAIKDIQHEHCVLAGSQTTASRGELKYLLDQQVYRNLMTIISPYLEFDEYPIAHIESMYLDTAENAMIRHSLDKPLFKEKLRIRTYRLHSAPEDRCFLEIKKKFKGVVYKRRIEMSYAEALEFSRSRKLPTHTLSALSDADRRTANQILKEMEWLFTLYGDLRPSFTVGCNRMAFKERDSESLRITFDSDITWSKESIERECRFSKISLVASGSRVMEIKSTKGLPEWLIDALSGLRLYPRSFSKVGASYREWVREMKRK